MDIGSREALREAVARAGVGTVSKAEYVPDARLRPLRIDGDPVETHIHVCCLSERRESRLVASFSTRSRGAGRSMHDGGRLRAGPRGGRSKISVDP